MSNDCADMHAMVAARCSWFICPWFVHISERNNKFWKKCHSVTPCCMRRPDRVVLQLWPLDIFTTKQRPQCRTCATGSKVRHQIDCIYKHLEHRQQRTRKRLFYKQPNETWTHPKSILIIQFLWALKMWNLRKIRLLVRQIYRHTYICIQDKIYLCKFHDNSEAPIGKILLIPYIWNSLISYNSKPIYAIDLNFDIYVRIYLTG